MDQLGKHMAVPESNNAPKRPGRRIVELITAAAFLVTILAILLPDSNTGRMILVAAAAVCLVGLKLLFKWPSV